MKITDLEGNTLEVIDLEKAIQQAKLFKDFRHADKSYKKLDETLCCYWTDIYEKLLKLK